MSETTYRVTTVGGDERVARQVWARGMDWEAVLRFVRRRRRGLTRDGRRIVVEAEAERPAPVIPAWFIEGTVEERCVGLAQALGSMLAVRPVVPGTFGEQWQAMARYAIERDGDAAHSARMIRLLGKHQRG